MWHAIILIDLISLNFYAIRSDPEPQIEDDGHRIRAVMWMVACDVKGMTTFARNSHQTQGILVDKIS